MIVLFSTFVSMAQGGQANLMDFADIPISIILGIILGAAAGYMLSLFVLVGAAVDIRYTLDAGAAAVLMILIALAFRSVGVAVCLLKTSLNRKERLFCIIAYLPKATVQAAIGSVPMAMGLPRRSFSFTSAGQPFCCFVFFLNLFAV